MPKHTFATCRDCRRHRDEAGTLTHTRLCIDCAKRRMAENNEQIHAKSGPYYENRIYGMVRAELGPRVALALRQTGVITAALDDLYPPA